jgi:hypothetical protein
MKAIRACTGLEMRRAKAPASTAATSSAAAATPKEIQRVRHTSPRKSDCGATAPTTHARPSPMAKTVVEAR